VENGLIGQKEVARMEWNLHSRIGKNGRSWKRVAMMEVLGDGNASFI
jgi:hypothetical protein